MSTSFPNVGKYQILEEVGRGGMGAVYKGHDPFLDRTVAIKLLAPHLVWEKAFLERFMREARAAARLDHPNVIHIYDVGQDGNNYYFVMAYLPGPSLKDFICQKGRLAPAEALPILRQLAAALDYAHSKGLIHRDVKPANVMFNEHGQAVLMDFGIVKAVEESRLTSKGTSIGTPQYMAPEQIRGPEVDARTDEYALGIIAFEMLSGRVPFDGDSTTVILYKQVNEPPPSATACCPDLPAAVEVALNRALSKSSNQRYNSCGEFVRALEQALAQPVVQQQPQPQPVTPPVDRTRLYGETLVEPKRELFPAGESPSPGELQQPAPRPVAPPPVQPRPAQQPGPIPSVPPVPKRSVPGWVWAVGGLALLTCLIGAVALIAGVTGGRFTGSTPIAAVQQTSTPADTLSRPTSQPFAPTSTPTSKSPTPVPTPRGPWETFGDVNQIQDLFLDGTTLWAATSGGLVRWNMAEGSYRKITVNDGLPSNDLYAVYVDSAGTLWVGSASTGLSKFVNNQWMMIAGKDVLGSDTVQDIVQDKNGNLWIGTDGGGASRFDGSKWTRFTPDNSTVDRNVYVIYVDEDGSLWFGAGQRTCYPCSGDLAHYDGRKWERFGRNDGIPGWQGRTQSDVWDIVRVPGGGLWIAAPGGIGRYQNGKWETLSDAQTSALLVDGNTVWTVSWQKGIDRYDGKSGQSQGNERSDERAKYAGNKIVRASDGSLWAGGVYGLLQRLPTGKWREYTIEAPIANIPVGVAQSIDGTLWAVSGRGVQSYDGRNWKIFAQESLNIGELTTVFVAQNEVVWIGGREGLAWYSNGKWESRRGGWVEKIIQDSSGAVWFSGISGEVLKYLNGQWTTYSDKQGDFSAEAVDSMVLGRSGSVWLLPRNSGAIRIPSGGGKADWQTFTARNGLNSDNVQAVLEDSQSRYWFSTDKSIQLRLPDSKWQDFGTKPSVERSQVLVEDNQGTIWAGGAGLSKYQNGSWSVVLPKNAQTINVLIGHDGTVWAATYGDGVYKIQGEKISHHVAGPRGLASNYAVCVFEDAAGTIWICTMGGLSNLDPRIK